MITLTQLTRTFPTPHPVTVLDRIDWHLDRGAAVAVVGPSGSGKSTLLGILGALDRPSSGTVEVAGQRLGELDDRALASLRATRLGMVFQDHNLLPHLTALENVLVPVIAARGDRHAARARAEQLLGRLGLSDREGHFPGQLSRGQAQRVAVARALINGPDVLLADEPTGALDRETAADLGDLLVELNREQGSTLVVATHAPALAARMDAVFELVDGRLVPQGA